ncbi:MULTISPECIES: hypothetical protein [Thermoactinomyces]|jgi:hypothetical protein|uniref:Uncharacterized protein n=1 Tax=Thermoactinomyces daqus TaxID=1329516 RepID=A0A7W2AHT5_9BACL|nr:MULTISPECIES: hypothetical protein [Thermoactinomyces]MBA4543552.1 hypothetical protein [Thermoactinomyces daqus]MBH8599113.1 hypothetical protein [Thermoactinomyces sp. CICC 10523]MBH8605752.1 hypothetical protein [Thermoactinomyces sp. CICC 10522]MBH8607955.1 hypothetical protein [Thermoactinomyces sp. CICC 10521]
MEFRPGPSAKEISEILEVMAKKAPELLEVVSNKVPEVFTKLFDILYSEDSAREMGKAIGSLYKELIDAGIPQDAALKMTSDYMFSLKDLVRNFSSGNKQFYFPQKDWRDWGRRPPFGPHDRPPFNPPNHKPSDQ